MPKLFGFGWFAVLLVTVAVWRLAPDSFAQTVRRPTPNQEKTLKLFVRSWAGAPYEPFEQEGPTRFSAALVSLQADGKAASDAIVYVTGRGWCGSGGCVTLILAPEGSSYRIITKITISWPPIRVLASSSNGWHDLGVMVHGGGIMKPYEARLSFDGKTYASNPSFPPAQPMKRETKGVIAIPISALDNGELVYR